MCQGRQKVLHLKIYEKDADFAEYVHIRIKDNMSLMAWPLRLQPLEHQVRAKSTAISAL